MTPVTNQPVTTNTVYAIKIYTPNLEIDNNVKPSCPLDTNLIWNNGFKCCPNTGTNFRGHPCYDIEHQKDFEMMDLRVLQVINMIIILENVVIMRKYYFILQVILYRVKGVLDLHQVQNDYRTIR